MPERSISRAGLGDAVADVDDQVGSAGDERAVGMIAPSRDGVGEFAWPHNPEIRQSASS